VRGPKISSTGPITRLSENGESIAVLGGEDEERNAVSRSLRTVLRRWRDISLLLTQFSRNRKR
jgi:ABC-type uncharacterized transport system fused permease/ATPase subunit